MFKLTTSQLIRKAQNLNLKLEEQKVIDTLNKTPKTEKYSNWELTKLISNRNLVLQYGTKEAIPKSLLARNQLQSGMKCKRYTDLKPEQQDMLLQDNNDYIAELKCNGNRSTLFYTPEEGIKVYTDGRDTDKLLPIEYTQQLLWDGREYRHKFPYSFILDCEILVNTRTVDTTQWGGVVSDSELSAVNMVLQQPPEVSHIIQKTQRGAELFFKAFDLPFYKHSLADKPYRFRRKHLEEFIQVLNRKFPELPISVLDIVTENKKYYFESMLDNMKEGIVLKNLNGIYTWNETRSIDRQVKLKRSLKMTTGEDIDVFIIGSVPSTEGKRNANYIGGFKLGVLLRGFTGDVIHHVATITSLPDNLRKEATVYNQAGEPELNPSFLNRCLSIDGFDVKQQSLRFSHARVESWVSCWRMDKVWTQCIISEEFLLNQSL